MIKFIFCEPSGFIGRLICKLTQGKFCHVAICIDGVVYEAKEFFGIIKTDFNDWNKKRKFNIKVEHIIKKDYLKFKQFLESKVGGNYDWRGIFSFITFSQSQDQRKYYCSELANEFFEVYFNDSEKYLITPNTFYKKIRAFNLGLTNI